MAETKLISATDNLQTPVPAGGADGKKKVPRRSKSTKRSKKKSGGQAANIRQPRPFPANPLENALRIPQALKEKNGGNPWEPAEIAKALGIGGKTPGFYALTASSRDYGLTTGTRDSAQIALQSIGRDIVYAVSREAEQDALKRAFLNVQVFKDANEYYKGGALPELQYLQNTLQTKFNIDQKYHQEFFEVYTANLEFLDRFGIEVKEALPSSPLKETTPVYSVVVGEPKTQSSLVAFVAMPFVEKTDRYARGFFDEVIRNLITPAAVEAGFRVATARREGSDVIHSTIVNDILEADLVIADLTEHNPNVLFELGLRMATEKPVALIRARGTSAIFDVDNLLRVLDYDANLWKSTLEIDVPRLVSHIKGSWESRGTASSYMQILRKTQ
jgi:hypothetical protein